MAEIDNQSTNKKTGKVKKLIRKTTRVDLTPMVDLGFLLITFFVFTTQLSQPTVMNLNMPYDKVKPGDDLCASCVLTVMLKDNNVIQYYAGIPAENTVVTGTDFAGIRRIILEKKAAVKKIRGRAEEFVLIIKASDKSSFQNFVDIVDEATINQVKRYYLAEPDALDQQLFALN